MGFNLLSAVPILGGIIDTFDQQRRAGNAGRERQNSLAEYARMIEEEYQNLLQQTRVGGAANRGMLNEALDVTGRGLGSSLAGAGVYNSSAAAGALSNFASEGNRTLADIALKGQIAASNQKSAGLKSLSGMKIGIADNNYNDARESLNSSYGGLATLLGQLTQKWLQPRGPAPGGGRSSVLTKPNNSARLLPQDKLVPGLWGMGSAGYGSGNYMGA